ncbi:hypothetical protein [Planotetraspora sp. GP83]|uniref:hypothetical protein n=1 Tax=Planotetraspora sp. GP83 TaxID=3156264 RepID=UPI00351181E2
MVGIAGLLVAVLAFGRDLLDYTFLNHSTEVPAPPVRREGPLIFRAGIAYDLDSKVTDWVPTNDAWKGGQDVGYAGDNDSDWIVGLNGTKARPSGESVAAIPASQSWDFNTCAKIRLGDKKLAPRNDAINPKHAFCLLTTEGRYALVRIDSRGQGLLRTHVTVWEADDSESN